uniref:reDPBB_sym1 protein n=1 Tax=synthetic construct TaxID=32630 RepID=UPI001CC331D2|nr:Chain A, reDPBB_sym1 protein [synthetic construct]7DVC_B Chain B, reDPBB_sym1 protein [synthetic construct]7DVC_C Chain C, reDPBB_sym1 protein [synthetic construct]7DVC_D Chain D, reDPBB_sym1 protein [synthetic construct]7DVC_E Chain E, reDPBB_sym1 protein [synthetic construct]7DVC_F Chain F, reDPBB_sym1 protein [synthetic construct]
GPPIKLRVMEAYPEDVGKGIVRMDKASRDKLGVSAGDLVEIKGSKTPIKLRVMEAYPEDVGKGIVRMDKASRDKLGVSAGDLVEIKG